MTSSVAYRDWLRIELRARVFVDLLRHSDILSVTKERWKTVLRRRFDFFCAAVQSDSLALFH